MICSDFLKHNNNNNKANKKFVIVTPGIALSVAKCKYWEHLYFGLDFSTSVSVCLFCWASVGRWARKMNRTKTKMQTNQEKFLKQEMEERQLAYPAVKCPCRRHSLPAESHEVITYKRHEEDNFKTIAIPDEWHSEACTWSLEVKENSVIVRKPKQVGQWEPVNKNLRFGAQTFLEQ